MININEEWITGKKYLTMDEEVMIVGYRAATKLQQIRHTTAEAENVAQGNARYDLVVKQVAAKVIENIGLLEYLPNMVNLMDTFLEKANPLPVGKHSSDEFRTFENIAQPMEQLPNIDDYDDCFRINGKKYMIRSVSCTATHAEIYNCDMLKKHAECMQRYIDPAAVVVNHDNNWRLNTSIIDECNMS